MHGCCILFRSVFPDLIRPVRGLECAAAGREGRERGGERDHIVERSGAVSPRGHGILERRRRRDSWPR